MSFREYLKYIRDDYEGHERDLIDDMIKEIKDGRGCFKEMMATQGADMGTFAKKPIKRLTLDEDGAGKTAVVAFGRMNPPTIGHQKLVDTMASLASGEKAKLYLSHKQDDKTDPLYYESKLRWCEKAFGDKVDVIRSNAVNAFKVLADLYEAGYTDIIYVGGEDRVSGKGKEDISRQILNYNGNPTKAGPILYDFNSIDIKSAGPRNPDSDDPTIQASASLVRKLVLENNFEEFKKYVPFNEKDAKNLFKELKHAMKGKEESFLEACDDRIQSLREANAGEDYEIKATEYLNNKYGSELPGVEFKHMGGNDNSKPDILVQFTNNPSDNFYIECKDLPAQAGEFALRIDNDELTFIPNQNTSEEEGGKDTSNDIKCKQAIVDWLNNSKYKDDIINNYSTKGEVNLRLKDQELINLMKDRIKVHYGNMAATWFCAPSRSDEYAFVLVNELDHLMNIDAVTVRNKSNNSKNISVASYDSFNEFAKKNGFTNLIRSKRGKENVVTFDSNKDLGLKNAKQNIRILIDDKEYVITINTHPKELKGMYMLRNSNRGNIKILASLGKAKSGIDEEEKLINYIKTKL